MPLVRLTTRYGVVRLKSAVINSWRARAPALAPEILVVKEFETEISKFSGSAKSPENNAYLCFPDVLPASTAVTFLLS